VKKYTKPLNLMKILPTVN